MGTDGTGTLFLIVQSPCQLFGVADEQSVFHVGERVEGDLKW